MSKTLRLEVAADAPVEQITQAITHFISTGDLPVGAVVYDATDQPPTDCECGLIDCACVEARQHRRGCRYRAALLFPIDACPHDSEACLICDPCTCQNPGG